MPVPLDERISARGRVKVKRLERQIVTAEKRVVTEALKETKGAWLDNGNPGTPLERACHTLRDLRWELGKQRR